MTSNSESPLKSMHEFLLNRTSYTRCRISELMTFVSQYLTKNVAINDTEPRCAPSSRRQFVQNLGRGGRNVMILMRIIAVGETNYRKTSHFRVAETSIYTGHYGRLSGSSSQFPRCRLSGSWPKQVRGAHHDEPLGLVAMSFTSSHPIKTSISGQIGSPVPGSRFR
jgi:hypothetical protein